MEFLNFLAKSIHYNQSKAIHRNSKHKSVIEIYKSLHVTLPVM